jgi:hypothetical protein
MGSSSATTKGGKNLLCALAFIAMLAITFFASVTGNDGIFAPMLMVDQIFLMIWFFKPGKTDNKTAYYAIITYGVIIGLLSVFMTLFGPTIGAANGWESHPNDQNGIVYPAVNDGLENCYFASLLYLCYYLFWIYRWLRGRKTVSGSSLV